MSAEALDVTRGMLKRFVQVIVTVVVQAAVLFLAAGRFDWGWAWVYLGVNLAGIAINATLMLRYTPETIAQRAESRGMKNWDKVIGGLWAVIYFIATLLVAGLHVRLGWPGQVALGVRIVAIAAFALGGALFSWAMMSNAYFSTVVRVQEDRGHAVCDTGPYRFVRHPGYVGAILQSLAVPLILGSPWALIPGGFAALLMVVRTALEDKTLLEELDGYREYAHQTRYRLLPGVW